MACKDIPEADALPIIALAKSAPLAKWSEGPKGEGSLSLHLGVVCNPPRRGLQIEIYVHRISKVIRRTVDFGLWDTINGEHQRVYQLTVADKDSPTHTEKGVTWFGSHEHLGNRAIKLNGIDDLNFEDALKLFLSKVNLTIEDGQIPDPLAFDLT